MTRSMEGFDEVSGLRRFRLRFRSDKDRNIRVGIFPKREEIHIRCSGLGRIALRSIGFVANVVDGKVNLYGGRAE